jgi:integrase
MMEEKNASGLTAETASKVATVVLSKGDSRYWQGEGRMFKNHGSPHYCCRFTTLGRREHFNLGSANKKTAASKAASIYRDVQSDGWEEVMARYKPRPDLEGGVTVGMLITEAEKHTTVRPQSFAAYVKAFRRIVADIRGIEHGGKYISRGKGASAWQEKVDSVPLELITPSKVNEWKIAKLRDAGADPLVRRRTVVTVNSLLRNADSLFGKKLVPHIEGSFPLPRPFPFDGVSLEKPPSMRYHSKIDAFAILAAAKEELATSEPEAFKILLLALYCGLRRSEIDNLLWRSFDFTNSRLIVESTEFHQLKSEDSAGVLDLNSEVLARFREWRHRKPTSTFVVESDKQPKASGASRFYRCDAHFKMLTTWLRGKGVDSIKPLHTLRKEVGSIIASEHGIFEASRFLRHSDIRITSAIYADKKKVITPRAFEGVLGAGG